MLLSNGVLEGNPSFNIDDKFLPFQLINHHLIVLVTSQVMSYQLDDVTQHWRLALLHPLKQNVEEIQNKRFPQSPIILVLYYSFHSN